MNDINKAHLATDGEHVKLTMPISKVDAEKRIVSGFATLDNVDRQGDIITAEASQKAFERFRGNVRLMHQPIPAGKVINFREDSFFDAETNKQYRGVFVDTYISKGAPEVWEMVLDGTLTGFSIGGAIKDFDKVYDAAHDATIRVVKDYDLVELSLVDSPANQLANIFSIEKLDKDGVAIESIFNKSTIQNVFWCETDQLAYSDYAEVRDCLVCEKDLSPIGWMDIVEGEDMSKAMGEMIAAHLEKGVNNIVTDEDVPGKYPKVMPGTVDTEELAAKPKVNEKPLNKASYSVGDFVKFNSKGTLSYGKIANVITYGRISINGSNKYITASKENPVAVINMYEKVDSVFKACKPKKKMASNMSSLKTWNTITKSLSDIIDDKKATDVAKPLIKGGVEVAENTENTEVVEAAEEVAETATAVEETAEETVEKSDEVVETVDEVVEEAEDAVEEVAAEEVAEVSTDASTDEGEAAEVDVEKALESVKTFITESFEKSASDSEAKIAGVAEAVTEVAKATAQKHDELTKALAEVQAALAALNGRVESVENDTAVRKSAEIENFADVQTTTMQKSLWGGRFLGSAQLFE